MRSVSQSTSLCLIVRDEESSLPACLASVAGLFSEIIVIDTGSADRTKELAVQAGARVFDFPWCDDFAAARNEALRHATGDWIFWLDADDRLEDANREKLRALLNSLPDGNVAFAMKTHCLPDPETGTATVVDHVRLFRRHPEVRWQYRVHEQILPALNRLGTQVLWTDIVIHHTGYQDAATQARKLARNLRLLEMEIQEQPDEPFVLFNLGWTYQALGRPAEAVPLLERSLARSAPTDSIVRKLYALLAGCRQRLGEPAAALAACRAGRVHHPDDPELLFLEGQLLGEAGRLPEALRCLEQLLAARPGEHFASYDPALFGWRARQHLAPLYRAAGRAAEAVDQWRQVLAEQPACIPARQGLAEAALARGDWAELESHTAPLLAEPRTAAEGALLRARGQLAQGEFAQARQTLEALIHEHPGFLAPRVILTHVLLQEGRDPAAAEAALRAVLERDPGQAESWRNLAVLARHLGRRADAAAACRAGLAHCPDDPHLLVLQGVVLNELGDTVTAETCFTRLLNLPDAGAADPVNAERRATARQSLGRIALARGRPAEAEAQFRAARAERAAGMR